MKTSNYIAITFYHCIICFVSWLPDDMRCNTLQCVYSVNCVLLCTDRLQRMCTESIDRVGAVIDGMIQQNSIELETGGNVKFEHGKPSDTWLDLSRNLDMFLFSST